MRPSEKGRSARSIVGTPKGIAPAIPLETRKRRMSKPIRSWFRMRADAASGVGTINILGDIGGYGQDFKSFSAALANLGPVNRINMTINSDGGDVSQGFAIYNALAFHPAQKTVTVIGLAASMASVVAMAGNVRKMPKNAVMMIHNPVGGIQGNADEIISFGEAVGDMRENIAQTYADASGGKLTKKNALALMDKQSWLGATECLALGLCTDIIEPMKMAASFVREGNSLDSARGKVKSKLSQREIPMTNKTGTSRAADAAMFEGEDDATVQAARADERKKILVEQTEVNALCRVAGRPELAAKFNEDGKTISEVVVALDK